MKVVLTGGAGYLGSVTARALLRSGHQVHIVDSLMHGGRPILELYSSDNFTFLRGDIRDEGSLEGVLDGAGAVVHLAAIASAV